ncbi:glycine cleavage system H protein [Aeropyrum camini SY1 = JCM 12091]|uniref:Glycine cleavage system H protein n=1 Tax=Aeropyrum camini SY1 = JCM 12091 TaxID=1198449 RepID=U3T9R3_9CREN|nr:glycine cleavage system H protein [Aeropyrum camini SY1 = JCM 12091]
MKETPPKASLPCPEMVVSIGRGLGGAEPVEGRYTSRYTGDARSPVHQESLGAVGQATRYLDRCACNTQNQAKPEGGVGHATTL